MSGCDPGAVEAYALGELEGEAVGRARAHLGGCAACARELALVRSERRALAAYARAAPRPLPDFEAVLARSRGVAPAPRALRPSRLARFAAALRPPRVFAALRPPPAWFALGACAAAAFVLQFSPGVGGPPFAPDDAGALACPLEEPLRFDVAVASAEDAFRACLMVTPTSQPPAGVSSDDGDVRASGLDWR